MKIQLILLVITCIIAEVFSSCALILDEHEEECAKTNKLSQDKVMELYNIYYSSADAPIINSYVECVWKKWGFLNGNVINYDAIRKKQQDITC